VQWDAVMRQHNNKPNKREREEGGGKRGEGRGRGMKTRQEAEAPADNILVGGCAGEGCDKGIYTYLHRNVPRHKKVLTYVSGSLLCRTRHTCQAKIGDIWTRHRHVTDIPS